jgi:hypothetical protein
MLLRRAEWMGLVGWWLDVGVSLEIRANEFMVISWYYTGTPETLVIVAATAATNITIRGLNIEPM